MDRPSLVQFSNVVRPALRVLDEHLRRLISNPSLRYYFLITASVIAVTTPESADFVGPPPPPDEQANISIIVTIIYMDIYIYLCGSVLLCVLSTDPWMIGASIHHT